MLPPPTHPPKSNTALALSVAAGINLGGLALDLTLGGRGMPAPQWPDTLVCALLFLLLAVISFLLFRKNPSLRTLLGGNVLALTTLTSLMLWGLLAGIFPQVVSGVEAPLHQRVLNSPPFVLSLLLLMLNLIWGILNRLTQGPGWSSLFLFNHLGVLIALGAGLFGASDLRRLDLWIGEDEIVWYGSANGHILEVPFAIHLHRFSIEYFPSVLEVINPADGKILSSARTQRIRLTEGNSGKLGPWAIDVLATTDQAPWSHPGDALPAARIRASVSGADPVEGWISSGSLHAPPIFLPAGEASFAMAPPQAKRYESQLTVIRENKDPLTAHIEVNKPLRVDGWWLYQKGYAPDPESRGMRSQIEAIRDPWLPGVYTGLALMAAGSLLCLGRASMLLRTSPIPPPGIPCATPSSLLDPVSTETPHP